MWIVNSLMKGDKEYKEWKNSLIGLSQVRFAMPYVWNSKIETIFKKGYWATKINEEYNIMVYIPVEAKCLLNHI